MILNRPGAGGLIAAQAAATAAPDGYTLYMTQASTWTVLPIQQGDKMPIDLFKAFAPISLVGTQPIAVSVNPQLGVNNVPELIAKIKATQGGMLFGATNRGGQSHLTGELFKRRAAVPLDFVHAQGAAASITDVAAGRIPIIFEGIAGVGGAAQGGLVKIIGIASEKRLPNYPDLPTIAETLPGFQSAGWLAADGADRHAGRDHPEDQCRPENRAGRARDHRRLRQDRHLSAVPHARRHGRLHQEGNRDVVAAGA